MATVLIRQEAMLQAINVVERPLKKIQHVQEECLYSLKSIECLYAKITFPANFAGLDNSSDLNIARK